VRVALPRTLRMELGGVKGYNVLRLGGSVCSTCGNTWAFQGCVPPMVYNIKARPTMMTIKHVISTKLRQTVMPRVMTHYWNRS
jgi:hypothetical protein